MGYQCEEMEAGIYSEVRAMIRQVCVALFIRKITVRVNYSNGEGGSKATFECQTVTTVVVPVHWSATNSLLSFQ